MAFIGLSIILASVVYVVFRRPPLIQTFIAIFRGEPRIEQPPTTASLPSAPAPEERERAQPGLGETSSRPSPSTGRVENGSAKKSSASASAAMPPPPLPPKITPPTMTFDHSEEPSPQTTPKATPSSRPDPVPTFTLSDTPSIAAPTLTPSANTMPPPPPRLPRLNPLPTNSTPSSSLAPAPQRGLPARQPGCSTMSLAPPPTHSSKPSKPSRAVVLPPGHSPLDWARISGPTSDLRGLPPSTPYLRVTPSMLKKQNGRKGTDAWCALGGRVYNISPYAKFHPGGVPELYRGAGKDGTKLFGEIHPWVNYEGMLKACLVGILVAEDEGKSEMEEMD